MITLPKILVSRCLYGDIVCRYDAAPAQLLDPIFLEWKARGLLVPCCPEAEGGLPTPRNPSERRGEGVYTNAGKDVTAAFYAGAEAAVTLAREANVSFCILKEGSPSCGVSKIYDGSFTGKKITGNGVAAEALKKAGFAVFSEHELEEAKILL